MVWRFPQASIQSCVVRESRAVAPGGRQPWRHSSPPRVAYALVPGTLEASRRIISLPSYPRRRVEIEALREVKRDFREARRLDSDKINGGDRLVTATGHVTPMVLDSRE